MKINLTEILRSLLCSDHIREHSKGDYSLCADAAILQLLKEERSHAHHILTRLLKDWELYQVKVRLEREVEETLRRCDSNERAKEAVDTLSRKISESVTSMDSGRPEMIHTGHLLFAVMGDKAVITARILELYGVTPSQVEGQIYELPADENYYDEINALRDLQSSNTANDEQAELDFNEYKGNAAAHTQESVSVLEKFAVNLTRSAADGEIDCLVGREEEIERLIQVLGRRKKNNPLLIGEAGVGKSAIIEGFALRIHNGEVPTSLLGKELYSLDLASLVAGTKFRGEFEARIKTLLDELKNNTKAILFIDEIHTIVGAGSTQGNLDAANILKPALARGTIQCIGATTIDEYREFIESDTALERRFQRIMVEPTNSEQTLHILHRIREYYELHHTVKYTDKALKSCVEMAGRYINDRHFPDKAIDILDEAGSRTHLKYAIEPESIRTLEMDYLKAKREFEEAMSESDFSDIVTLKSRSLSLKEQWLDCKAGWRRQLTLNPPVVDVEQIEQIINSMTGIPVDKVSKSEQERLMKLGEHLENIVIGQQEAVLRVTKSIRRSRAGLKDENRPIGVFMFVGPTGVGKTLLAKELSKWMFDRDESLIRIDMSEYSEKHAISRLIGPPPGYVGHSEGGQLTESVRRQPYAVVLFDEIEKAHPDMFNLMLQILDEGHVTDSMGRKVDFRNTIIIMTSNVGSQAVINRGNQVGYDTRGTQNADILNRESIYRKSLEHTFAPEFINRVDDIIVFNTLSLDDIGSIVDLEVEKLRVRASALGFTLKFSAEAKAKLVSDGYQPRYGVRSLRRAILDMIEEPLADMIVCGEISGGETIMVSNSEGEIELLRQAI